MKLLSKIYFAFLLTFPALLISQPAKGPGAKGSFTNLQRRIILRQGTIFAANVNNALTNSFIPVGDGTYYCKVNLIKGSDYNFIFQVFVNSNWKYEQLPAVGSFPCSYLSNSVTSSTAGRIIKIDNDIRRKITIPNYGSGTNYYVFCNFGHHPNPPYLYLIPQDKKVIVRIKSQGRWDNSPEPDVIYGGYFELYRSTTNGGPYNFITNLSPNPFGETEFIDTNVVNNTTYYYVVIAKDAYQGTNVAPVDKEVPVPDFNTFIAQKYIDANMSSGYSLEKNVTPTSKIKVIFKVQNIDWDFVEENDKIVWLTPIKEDARFYYNKIPARIERVNVK